MTDSPREPYVMGYGPWVTALLTHRSAQTHAAFLMPHLKSGQRVLDCGCGPGAITLGLAQAVKPGLAVGIDVEARHVDLAARAAATQGISNARFRTGSAYSIPYPDQSFDVVYMSAVLGNLREPERALAEAYRVLTPGGMVAIREFDHGGDLVHPDSVWLKRGRELYDRLRLAVGHDPYIGRKLRALLQDAGYKRLSVGASYETVVDDEVLRAGANIMAEVVLEAWSGPLIERDMADRDTVQRIAAGWRELAESSGGMIAAAWCEAIGYTA